jgi:hypothetical protein
MNPSAILFLDIDGVLNTPTSCSRHRSNEVFLPTTVAALLRILQQTACEVVISSSWRMEDQRHRIVPVFEKNGLAALLPHIVGHTPIFGTLEGTTREDEIEAWLAENQPGAQFAILDDDVNEFRGDLRSHLIHINDQVGLSATDAAKCIEMLRTKPI